MPPQPRNNLTVTQIPGIDTIRVNLIDEHRFESRLYLSLEQAEQLIYDLSEALEQVANAEFLIGAGTGMGYRKDDCQFKCEWDARERDGFNSSPDFTPDPRDPEYQMCMDVCEEVFPHHRNLVGTIKWDDVKRALQKS